MKHLGTKKIETTRLILRKFKESDAFKIYNSFINNKDFLYYTNRDPVTLEEEKESLKDIDKKYNKKYYNWLITLKDDTVIGAIHLNVFNYNESLEFNYAIDDNYKNHGYMTEALDAVKDFVFNELKVNRFYGGCEVNNIASKRVMEKCNFTYEGTFRNCLKLRDGYHDLLMYSYINEK